MLEIFKKIFKSKLFRLIFSAVLIYFAFKKVDISEIGSGIRNVPVWFVLVNLLITVLLLVIISVRWSLLLFSKIKLETIWTFNRANFLATFYSFFFSTAVVGEIVKWVVIDSKYPKISKTKILGSIVLDRFIGITVFVVLGLISAIIGNSMGLTIPSFIFYFLIFLNVGCLSAWLVVYLFDVSKLLPNFKLLHKLDDAFELFREKNKIQIIKCIFVSILSETIWILQIWFVGWHFGVNLGLLSVFVFIPVISIILVLPISIGGFGAREQLYLLFFTQGINTNESILLMSTFLGILGIFNSIIGGILLFLDKDTKKKLDSR